MSKYSWWDAGVLAAPLVQVEYCPSYESKNERSNDSPRRPIVYYSAEDQSQNNGTYRSDEQNDSYPINTLDNSTPGNLVMTDPEEENHD
jgi:hypothetical protein